MYLLQGLIFCAVVGSNIHWQWTPNQYRSLSIGTAGYVASRTKKRPPPDGWPQALKVGDAMTRRHAHRLLLGSQTVDLNQRNRRGSKNEATGREWRPQVRGMRDAQGKWASTGTVCSSEARVNGPRISVSVCVCVFPNNSCPDMTS
jgi:hypothetical protein